MRKKIELIFFLLILVAVNVFLVYPIFQGDFTRFSLSIESVFLTDAKFIAENFPHIAWYPFWYFGLPFYLVYQPIPIFLTAIFSLLPWFSVAQSYRFLTGFFLILGAAGVYFWAKQITRNRLASLVAAISFSVLPSAAFIFLEPGWRGYGLIPLRLVNTLVYGEGPHMWGLALVPFACLSFQQLLRHPKRQLFWIATVLLIAVILLTSLTAFTGLLVFLFFIFWIEGSKNNFKEKLLTALLVGVFAFGLSFFWYNPEFLRAALGYSLGDGGGIFSGIWSNFVFTLFVVPTFLFGSYIAYGFLKEKLGKEKFRLVLPISLFIFLFVVIWGWFAWDAALFPLPFRTIPRLIPELELVFALLLAAVIAVFPKRLGYVLAGIVIVATLFTGWNYKEKFWYITRPHENFSKTSEYAVAKKLNDLRTKRVYATGTHAFWLNLFSDTTQLRGGKGGDFSGLNSWWAHLSYFINRGEGSQLTEKWLRSLGLEYLVVNFPGSPVYYHDFKNIERFNSFEEVFNYQGDKILRLPTKNTSLVLSLPQDWDKDIEKPKNLNTGTIVLDEIFLEKYFVAVEQQAQKLEVEYPFKHWSKIRIPGGQIDGDREILIRQTYYSGWKAKSNGKSLKIGPGPIGFTKIENPGSEEIILKYFPSGLILSSFISLVILGGFIAFLRKNN